VHVKTQSILHVSKSVSLIPTAQEISINTGL